MPKKPTVLPPSAMPLPLSKAGEPQSWARKWCRVCARVCTRACAHAFVHVIGGRG